MITHPRHVIGHAESFHFDLIECRPRLPWAGPVDKGGVEGFLHPGLTENEGNRHVDSDYSIV